MDDRDKATHQGLTRLHAKFEKLDFAQAEAIAYLDRLRLQREGARRWDDVELTGRHAAHR